MFGARTGPSLDELVERAVQATAWGDWGDGSGLNMTWAGNAVSLSSSLQLLAVYGCNRFICEGISTLPSDVFRETGDVRSEVSKPAWLTQPTPDLDFIAWCTQVLSSLLLAGNAFLWVRRQGVMISEVVPLDPSTVTVSREQGRKVLRRNGVVLDGDIRHVPGVMFPGSDVGLSPIEAARQIIGAGTAVEEFAARFFGQGANMSGVIEDPGPLDPVKAKETARIFGRLHSGNRKAHLPAVLQGGAKWAPTGVTNEQAQFLQTRQFTAAQIASQMFLIDPTEFGMSMDKGSSVTYANLEQRNARKVQVTFLPWIIRLEAAITGLLPKPQFFKFNVNGLLRGDTKTRFETYEIASRINTAAVAIGQDPVLDTEEMREFEDLEPYDGALAAPVAPPVAAAAPSLVVNNHLPELQPRNNVTVVPGAAPAVIVRNDVLPTPVTVENRVDPTPVNVTVQPSPVEVRNVVEVEPTPVTVVTPARTRRVERDAAGNIDRVIEE